MGSVSPQAARKSSTVLEPKVELRKHARLVQNAEGKVYAEEVKGVKNIHSATNRGRTIVDKDKDGNPTGTSSGIEWKSQTFQISPEMEAEICKVLKPGSAIKITLEARCSEDDIVTAQEGASGDG